MRRAARHDVSTKEDATAVRESELVGRSMVAGWAKLITVISREPRHTALTFRTLAAAGRDWSG